MSMAFGSSTERTNNALSKINKPYVVIGFLGLLSVSLFIAVLVLAKKPRAADLNSYMNTTINPCDDFYHYTCSNWKNSNPANASHPQTSPLSVLQWQTYRTLSKLLQDGPDSSTTIQVATPRGIASFVYQKCVIESQNNNENELSKLIKQFNDWPILSNPGTAATNENLATIFDYNLEALIRYNLKIIFKFQIIPNMWEREKFILSIMKSDVISKFYPDPLPVNNYATINYIEALVCSLNPDCGILTDLRRDIKEINDLDKELKRNYVSYSENVNMTLAQLNQEVPLTALGRDWVQVARKILKDNTLDESYKVFAVTGLMNGIMKVLESKDPRVVKNWFVLQVLMELGPRFSHLFRPVSIDDEVRCAHVVNTLMPYAAAEIYNIHWSQIPGRKEMVDKLFREIRKVIFGLVVSGGWLDQDAIERIVKKLEYVVPFVGFPDWILNITELTKYYQIPFDLSSTYVGVTEALLGLDWPREANLLKEKLDRNKFWFMNNLLQANAWYAAVVNSITIPMGILDYPFLPDVTSPRLVIYGILGHIVAHEIFHGLDPIGLALDAEGQLISVPFSDKVTKIYGEKTQCIIDQYKSFGLAGELTVTEDFPDNAAMGAVFKAYQDRTATDDLFYDDALPTFDQPLSKQFFISFPSTWCMETSEEFLPVALKDVHSLGRYRVNVPLMNSQEFSEVFQCPKGSPMNPEHKCHLF